MAINPLSPNVVYAGSAVFESRVDAYVSRLNSTGSGLVYSTFLGGFNIDQGMAISIDSAGNAFVTGLTQSRNFPVTPGGFPLLNSFSDAFVSKVNPAGTGFEYSTYLGGNSSDRGFGIAIDSSGSAYVTGDTNSSNFPVTQGAFQTVLGGPGGGSSSDAFISKLLPIPNITSDLGISITAPPSATAGSSLIYEVMITNHGPETA